MKVIHGSRSDDHETPDFKTCPICGAVCFADMDTCFGCLHHFGEDEAMDIPVREVNREHPSEKAPSQTPSPEALIDDAGLSSLFVKANDLQPRQNNEAPIEAEDHHGALLESEEGLTSRHVCSDKEGRQFEISISVKLL